MRPSKLISPLAIRGMHYQSYSKPELLLLRPKRSRKQRRDPSFVFNLWLRARFWDFAARYASIILNKTTKAGNVGN